MATTLGRAGVLGALALVMCASSAGARTLSSDGSGAGAGAVLSEAAAALQPNRYVWGEDADDGLVSVVVSIPDQRAYVYRGQTLIAVSTVSTGRDGKETPVGIYPILQKQVMHRSNLYNSAPMPYMQRLTWDGIAIHSGRNPGFPDSHGCIRVPDAFAKKLFDVTAVGSVVEVTDEAAPDGPPPADAVPTNAAPIDETADETAQANREIASE